MIQFTKQFFSVSPGLVVTKTQVLYYFLFLLKYLNGTETRCNSQSAIASQKVKNTAGGNTNKHQSLVLNLVLVTHPFENVMKARKRVYTKLAAYGFWHSWKFDQKLKTCKLDCEPHGARTVF